MKPLAHVDYNVLDRAKLAFIAAGKKTMRFAEKFGFIPDERLGASANVFQLDLKPFLKAGAEELYITLLPEGLGTADDARPEDLSDKEQEKFWHNIGIKTVAVMTNDAASSGMQTILISLYLPSAQPELVFHEQFMKGFLDGFVAGCKKVGCVYFSGETPQLKNKLVPGKMDIAGALFGLVPAGKKPVSSDALQAGDHIVFIQSSGPHENGFTTLRALAETLPNGYRTKLPSGMEYWEALNQPSVLYTPVIQQIMEGGISLTNIEPISGHGWQKLMRPKQKLRYKVSKTLPVTEIFSFVQEQLKLTTKQMIEIFNYGLGYAVFTRTEKEAQQVVEIAKKQGLNAVVAGKTEASDSREVVVEPWDITLTDAEFTLQK